MNARKSRERRRVFAVVGRPIDPHTYVTQSYVAPMIAAAGNAGRDLIHAYILDDEWCAIFRGGTCDCDPEIMLRPEDAKH